MWHNVAAVENTAFIYLWYFMRETVFTSGSVYPSTEIRSLYDSFPKIMQL